MNNLTPPFPDKKYDIIYADPAWYAPEAKGFTGGGSIKRPYPCMTIKEIKELPVSNIAKENSLLFLWVISPDLPECISVGKAWGFDYITVAFIWEKQKTLYGNYTLPSCEMCLVFKKGKIPQPRGKRNVRQFLSVKRGRHSAKPKEVRERITEMFPTQSKIELFARPNWTDYNRDWDFWGNEVQETTPE